MQKNFFFVIFFTIKYKVIEISRFLCSFISAMRLQKKASEEYYIVTINIMLPTDCKLYISEIKKKKVSFFSIEITYIQFQD